MNKHFNLDKVKEYLDKVLADEEYLKTYKDVADDVYRVFNYKAEVSVKDVEEYLKGLPIGVEYMIYKTCPLARTFAKDIDSLTKGMRDEDGVYWWAIATGIWVYGGMERKNPQYKWCKGKTENVYDFSPMHGVKPLY